MRNAIFAIILGATLAAAAPAQNVAFGPVVGVPQTVPDPFNPMNTPGSARLDGLYCQLPFRKLVFDFVCLPPNYVIPIFTETCYFVIDVGPSTLPGVTILQGQFYVPFTPLAVIINAGGVSYIGPADVVCGGVTSFASPAGTCALPLLLSRHGAKLDLGSLVLGLPISTVFTVQAAMFDPAANRFFTSNALNLTVIP